MAIPTWVLPAPVLLAPGKRVAAVQLRELILRTPPDAPAGGAITVTLLDAKGEPFPDALALALTPEDYEGLDVLQEKVFTAIATLLKDRDLCDVRAASREVRDPVVPKALTPSVPTAGGGVVLGGLA